MKTNLKTAILFLILTVFVMNGFSQETEYDTKYSITVYTTSRSADGELFIKNGNGNTFTGILKIDGDEREVFGWYTEKKSEGGMFVYNTKGIVFYVKLNADFQHQQLFKGIFNYNETFISGDFFYWGNEFIFNGYRSQFEVPADTITEEEVTDTIGTEEIADTTNEGNDTLLMVEKSINDEILIIPNPFKNNLRISSATVDLQNKILSLYAINGHVLKKYFIKGNNDIFNTADLPYGSYIVKILDIDGKELLSKKLIKK
jgi:hypothetical protein